jgi:hypothetical protein
MADSETSDNEQPTRRHRQVLTHDEYETWCLVCGRYYTECDCPTSDDAEGEGGSNL